MLTQAVLSSVVRPALSARRGGVESFPRGASALRATSLVLRGACGARVVHTSSLATGSGSPTPRLPVAESSSTHASDDTDEGRHLVVALVDNEPGVLSKISGMFAGRSFNIDSLTVGQTDVPQLRRLTIAVKADAAALAQLERQLRAQVHVWRVVPHPPRSALEQELLLVRVQLPPPVTAATATATNVTTATATATNATSTPFASSLRAELHTLLALHNAAILDVGVDALVASKAAAPSHLDAFLHDIHALGLPCEIARSGSVVVAKAAKPKFTFSPHRNVPLHASLLRPTPVLQWDDASTSLAAPNLVR